MWAQSIGMGLLALPAIEAFTFSHTSGSQCQQMTLQWYVRPYNLRGRLQSY